jgi:hypothetical protein
MDNRWIRNQEEAQVALANTSTSQLQSLEKDGKDRLTDVLAKWAYYLGLTKLSPEDLAMLNMYIIRSYGNLTIEEIDLTIEYSTSGKLDVDTNPYGSFSPMYVSNMIGAYLRYRNRIMTEIIQRRASVIREESRQQAIAPHNQCLAMKETIRQCYEEQKTTGEITDFFNVIYNFLRRTSRMVETSRVSDASFKTTPTTFVMYSSVTDSCMEMARKKVASLAQQRGKKHILNFLDGEDETTIKKYARNYCVGMYFEKVTMETLLNEISETEFQNQL